MKETLFACDMSMLSPFERTKHIETMRNLFNSVKNINENKNGFTFLFPDNNYVLLNLFAFIEKEKLCCPFFVFIIEVNPQQEFVSLMITGKEGIKEFIKAEFGDYTTKF